MDYFSKTLPYIANTKFPSTLIPYVTEKRMKQKCWKNSHILECDKKNSHINFIQMDYF